LEQINTKLKNMSEAKSPSGEVIVEMQKEGEGFVFKIRGAKKVDAQNSA